MLDKPIDEIVYEGGKVVGVKSGGEVSEYQLMRFNEGVLCRLLVVNVLLGILPTSLTKFRK